jgi:hypothetical protein
MKEQSQPPGDPAELIRLYAEAWNSGNLNLIAGAYATPCFVVKGGRVLRHEDHAAKRRYFGELLAGNQQQGPHRWSTGDLDTRLLGRGAAMVTVPGSAAGRTDRRSGSSWTPIC